MKKKPVGGRFASLIYILLGPLARLLLRVRITGSENIPGEGGAVVAVNHISFLDVIAVSASFPRRRMPCYLAKRELFRIPVLASVIRSFGAIPIERRGSDVGAIRRAIAVAEGGALLSVFPQGTRQKGKNPADTPIKSGVAMIAHRAGVPVLPVCIKVKNNRYAFLRRVEILVGKPLSLAELSLSEENPDYRAAAERAFFAVCALGGYFPLAQGEEAAE